LGAAVCVSADEAQRRHQREGQPGGLVGDHPPGASLGFELPQDGVEPRKQRGLIGEVRAVVRQKIRSQGGEVGMLGRKTERRVDQAPGAGRGPGPVMRQGQGAKAAAFAQLVGGGGEIRRGVDQGAVEVKQPGLHAGRRACRK
jgi:hypothetical protein